MSRNSVSDVFHIADAKGISYCDIKNLEEEEVYRMFYPDKHAAENMCQDPDYNYVHEELDDFNRTPFQKREGSRYERFQEEKTHLHQLPTLAYEISEWIYGRKVNFDCHVIYGKNRYSCPYQHVGKKADLKFTDTSLEIHIQGERVATHNRLPDLLVEHDEAILTLKSNAKLLKKTLLICNWNHSANGWYLY